MAFRDLLFKPAEEPPVENPAVQPAVVSGLQARLKQLNTPSVASPTSSAAIAVVDPEFTSDLLEALDKSTLPGFKEFNAQMEILAGAIPDESTRVKVALATTAKFLNLQPSQIVAAVQEKIDILFRTKTEFLSGLQAEADQRTKSYSAHLNDLMVKLAAHDAEGKRLNTDLSDTTDALDAVKAESSAVQSRFESAYAPVQTTLTATLSLLKRAS